MAPSQSICEDILDKMTLTSVLFHRRGEDSGRGLNDLNGLNVFISFVDLDSRLPKGVDRGQMSLIGGNSHAD
jgi:hypothetical protein